MPEAPTLSYTFEAPTIQEALAQVRSRLGTQATIVETSRVSGRTWLGMGAARKVRVVASKPAPELDKRIGDLQRQLDSMSALWTARQALDTDQPSHLERLARASREAGLCPETISAMLADLDERPAARDAAPRPALSRILELWLTAQIPTVALELGTTVSSLAVVGPTGAGKTTLLAKLATAWRHAESKSLKALSLMTLDTHRMGGMEPLRTLAGIWGVPCDAIYSPADFSGSRERRSHRDLILIDTPGLSPFGRGPAEAAVECLAHCPADAVLLALPATTRWQEARRLAERYAPLKPTALAITKFDESDNPALILDLCRLLRLPLAFLSDSQDLSEDPHAARSATVAHAIAEQLHPQEPRGAQ